jgi:hypothetical protein
MEQLDPTIVVAALQQARDGNEVLLPVETKDCAERYRNAMQQLDTLVAVQLFGAFQHRAWTQWFRQMKSEKRPAVCITYRA